jgi:hypothetical protein
MEMTKWLRDKLNFEIVYLRQMLSGAKSMLYNNFHTGTGGTDSPSYCYAVWMRHLALCSMAGMPQVPLTVAEIGPGDSLGTGLAAILCGANTLYAFDAAQHSNIERNMKILAELVPLFQRRATIPASEFPHLNPQLFSYAFPHQLLTNNMMEKNLAPARLEAIRRAIGQSNSPQPQPVDGIMIRYVPTQHDYEALLQQLELDMIFSHTVMEFEQDLAHAYGVFYQRLKANGWMSHQIDFSAVYTSSVWNGHWSYSDLEWRIICGSHPYFLSRYPLSVHVQKMQEAGFEVVTVLPKIGEKGISRAQLAERFRGMSNDDLHTRNAFIVARKPDLSSLTAH